LDNTTISVNSHIQ